jgi:hypothetical protein
MAITLDGNNASTVGVINSATAVASTSGTSIDFTGIPSGVKRITVMFNGVSLNGSAHLLIQLGTSGTPTTSGYTSTSEYLYAATSFGGTSSTSGFVAQNGSPSYVWFGSYILSNVSSNNWVGQSVTSSTATGVNLVIMGAGGVSLGGTLNMVRITTSNGTDAFDAGSINILYE